MAFGLFLKSERLMAPRKARHIGLSLITSIAAPRRSADFRRSGDPQAGRRHTEAGK